jgi:hypothetical protein
MLLAILFCCVRNKWRPHCSRRQFGHLRYAIHKTRAQSVWNEPLCITWLFDCATRARMTGFLKVQVITRGIRHQHFNHINPVACRNKQTAFLVSVTLACYISAYFRVPLLSHLVYVCVLHKCTRERSIFMKCECHSNACLPAFQLLSPYHQHEDGVVGLRSVGFYWLSGSDSDGDG